jgi:hypothetical protein
MREREREREREEENALFLRFYCRCLDNIDVCQRRREGERR